MKCIVISGVTGGLGSHIATRALERGYEVVGMARRPPAEDRGYPVHAVDVADCDQVAAFFREIRQREIWALVNAAGIASMNLLLTTPAKSMARIIGTNLLGTMHCCAEGAKLLLRNKCGRIINFSSIAAPLGLAGESVYAASKAGVECFTRCLARELSGFGITANCVSPGPVETPLIAGLRPDQVEAVVQRQIVRRQGTHEDVWNSVAFLLSEESAMISGEVLHIGGV